MATMKHHRIVGTALGALLCAAAAHAGPTGFSVLTDLPYAPPSPPGSRGPLLDLYIPTGARSPFPV